MNVPRACGFLLKAVILSIGIVAVAVPIMARLLLRSEVMNAATKSLLVAGYLLPSYQVVARAPESLHDVLQM